MITVKNRDQCRLCGSTDLENFLTLENVPFFDEVITADSIGKEFIYPMKLYFCNDCMSVQTLHDVDLHEYYSSYQYVASNSMFIRQYMGMLAKEAFLRFGIKPGDAVIDIGAADGYMLSCFKDLGANVLGYEAAENLAVLAKDLDIAVLTKLFTPETVKEVPEEFKQVQAIVLLHTFDHLTDPGSFLDTVR